MIDERNHALEWCENEIIAQHQELAHKRLTYFVSVMAERLTFANRTIAVLRR
ncbi:hypothetical protein ACVIW0_007889 [Bradyrhizobium sp. USDA 4454]